MSTDLRLEDLLETAVLAGATDLVLAPAPHYGKLLVRAARRTLLSRTVSPELLRSLSNQLGLETALPVLFGGGMAHTDAAISSFEIDVRGTKIRIRVTSTPTSNGPLVTLRVQSPAVLERALAQFREGTFGGLDVLEHLTEKQGVIFVSGPPSGGKTSALHHLMVHVEGPLTVVSEARELDADVTPASVARTTGGVLVLDEMDESDKIGLALELGRTRLVLATLAAPDLKAALRRVRGRTASIDPLIGVLRVGWDQGADLRRPAYCWFPMEGRTAGGHPRAVPRELLTNPDDLAAYRTLEIWEQRS